MPENKLSRQVFVLDASTLSFAYLYKHSGLVFRVSGENFGIFGGNGGVMLHKSGHDTSSSLDNEGRGATSRRRS